MNKKDSEKALDIFFSIIKSDKDAKIYSCNGYSNDYGGPFPYTPSKNIAE